MDYFEKLIEPVLGGWTVPVAVVTLALVGVLKLLPSWLSTRRDALRGSPATPKYWRSRLAEAIEQHRDSIGSGERTQLLERITEARIMVEAHEAARRVGMKNAARPWWWFVAVFALMTAITTILAVATRSFIPGLLACASVSAMLGFEFLAISVSSAGSERLQPLITAGRYKHSDLVRTDPWLVLRTYDYWLSTINRRALISSRYTDYKERTTRRIRFQCSMVGIGVHASALEVDHDIWSLPALRAMSAPEMPSTRSSPDCTDLRDAVKIIEKTGQ